MFGKLSMVYGGSSSKPDTYQKIDQSSSGFMRFARAIFRQSGIPNITTATMYSHK